MRIFKLLITGSLVLFLVVHTSFTLIHVLPENMAPLSIKEKTKNYMAPLFDQGWALFAPVPEVNKKVYVSYSADGKNWSEWKAPFNRYLYAHQSFRASVNAKIVLLQSGALHYLYNENEVQLKQRKNIVGDTSLGYFRVLKYAVQQELQNKGAQVKKMKLLVIYVKASCSEKQTYSIYYPEFEAGR
ncbi:MAG TPA: DUF5819 family protein [Bacteroidia bacterium]|jgi:hypothetical protein|nr:DUF5819 family protein [Bacteroidia bacterium]